MNNYGLVDNTPLIEEFPGIWVKHEELSCPSPGPGFSKYRGVVAHLLARPKVIQIGVLDTYHSKAGWAVAYACKFLGRECINFYPQYKNDNPSVLRLSQEAALNLGARVVSLKAGRSAILYHEAKKRLFNSVFGGYMMPNALKLPESIEATAQEVLLTDTAKFKTVIIPASSGTIAAGVIAGFLRKRQKPNFIVHMGYSRSKKVLTDYLYNGAGYLSLFKLELVDEGYAYKDEVKEKPDVSWPCSSFYDGKAMAWLLKNRNRFPDEVLFWNIG